ncbi:MAG: hypothetical protein NWF00_07230 [Candidatus Bathyarchaeota archaeon]|nr:hypothetical protein [Candidatus Bathyarchaeota archaeon]
MKTEGAYTTEERGNYVVSIIGCGQKGVFYALAFAQAGFKVTCSDANQSVIKRLSKGNLQRGRRQTEVKLKSLLKKGQIIVAGDLKTAVAESDVTIITVGAKIDHKKNSDTSEAVNICKHVGKAIKKGSLVVYGGLATLGFVEGVVKETIENTSGFKAGEDFGLAYNPFFNSTCVRNEIGDKEAIVAANDKVSLNSAASIFEVITEKSVNKVSDIKMTEAAALFASAKLDLNAALYNELAVFCEKTGLDYTETMGLAENHMGPNSASPTIAEETNREEVYLLLETAENLNVQLRLPKLARQLNEDMIKHAINLTHDSLRNAGKTLRRAKIALLGAAGPETAAAAFVGLLEAKGAKVRRYDSYSSEGAKADKEPLKKTLNDAVEGADCVVILSEQEQFKRLSLKKLHALMKAPAALVDLVGVVEPMKVEKAGFIYRGLGRGDRKK